MRRCLLLLIPALALSQVAIDTVIRLPPGTGLLQSYYVPELNKLYLGTRDSEIIVLDCSTYQVVARIPAPRQSEIMPFTWNWRSHKMYAHLSAGSMGVTLFIDTDADTIVKTLPLTGGGFAYVSEFDLLYCNSSDSMFAYDGASDTILRRIASPLEGYGVCPVGWDSAGRKLYVGMAKWGAPSLLAVYDHMSGQFTKFIDVSSFVCSANEPRFNYLHRKAYFCPSAPFRGYAAVIDNEGDSLLRVFPLGIVNGDCNPIALNTRDDKVYIVGSNAAGLPDTLWVVDCATDSVLKQVEYAPGGWGALWVRWTPWSNRLYIDMGCRYLKVFDCNTDSVIVESLSLGHYGPTDIQVDPIRQRVFAVGVDSNLIFVLRDVEGGVAEKPASCLRPSTLASLRESPAGFELEYHVESPYRVEVSVYDLLGRNVKGLVAGSQTAGQHRVLWNRTDSHGARVTRGVYYMLVNAGATSVPLKAVVR
jgi:DNA-binding beta-propeller fold protein YncE